MIKRKVFQRTIHGEDTRKRLRNKQCPWCGLPQGLWKRNKRWTCCSKECTKEYYKNCITYAWAEVREKALERDQYTCRKCKQTYPPKELIGDHITPIALGGPEFNIDNVQTLCKKCNKTKTKTDQENIARARRIKRILSRHKIKILRT